ncbi:hypothetical protein HanIR_Chr02g0057171 [Helianthus annuus]|nr:hypothetical protein HanIR_Chr02g0057171 [Helianthus annuus]
MSLDDKIFEVCVSLSRIRSRPLDKFVINGQQQILKKHTDRAFSSDDNRGDKEQ